VNVSSKYPFAISTGPGVYDGFIELASLITPELLLLVQLKSAEGGILAAKSYVASVTV
jgi:hypothetical protein